MVHGVEDWEFWINLLKNTEGKVVQLDYIGYIHRAFAKNSRHAQFNSNIKNAENTYQYIYNKHQEHYQKYYGNLPMEAIREMSYYKFKVDRIENVIKGISPKRLLKTIFQLIKVQR